MLYDPFQKKAIHAVDQNRSVLVSAPTGAGKTAIAEYVIRRSLERNERVIYTAPIKAISNQKYRDFVVHFGDRIGILTGDVSINSGAPVLIMTTEIYRNQLFENPFRHENTSWIIFDEIHYLDDLERGTVWEEALMFSHPNTRLLALSATAPNIQELADWICEIHGHPVEVIEEPNRPVKLIHQFQCQNEIHADLKSLKSRGYLGRNFWPSARRGSGRKHRFRRGSHHTNQLLRAKPNNTHDLFKMLIKKQQLPCLYFAFGRRRVEELAREHSHLELLNANEKKRNRDEFSHLTRKYGLLHEPSAFEMGNLIEHGIAFHHAGMLPTLKEVVEQFFTQKLIKLIFTTETFALGINMPARTVCFDELKKFYGFGFEHLTTRDYYQMAGRAGRRGIDTVGFVYARVNPHFSPFPQVQRIVEGKMEPIKSQFNASFATLLHLYKRFGDELTKVYARSFHAFRSGAKKRRKAIANIENKLSLLKHMGHIAPEGLTPKGEFASCLYGYELILSELLDTPFMDQLNEAELAVLITAVVYEPRVKEHEKPLPSNLRFLQRQTKRHIEEIQQEEYACNLQPPTKPAYFHLAEATQAWVAGVPFYDLHRHTDIDEGAIIRYFRMTIQILRQLKNTPHVSDKLKKTTQKVIPLINRDIVDAEKLLRINKDE